MYFRHSAEIEDLRLRVAAYVDTEILPIDAEPTAMGEGENIAPARLEKLRAKVKDAGLWCPQMPTALGGLGINTVGMALLYEEMGRSRFGPVAFNCAAPDDGNMICLLRCGTEEQQERWLRPIVDGKVRSAIVMTEPAPGSGSDPAGMMQTRAEKRNDRYIVRGKKWFITGAEGAQHFILLVLMAS